MSDCLDNIMESIDRMHKHCDRIEAALKSATKMIQEERNLFSNLGWHKLPPIPGWYASASLYQGRVEGVGTNIFMELKISETSEQKSVWYYGPLPISEIESNGEEND